MTKQVINVGATANDKKGDSLRAAFQKVNANFTELYTSLGLDVAPLNLGAFEFTGSVMSTTDSTPIVIDQAATVTSDLTVGGDVLPSVANGGDLGSAARPWKSLYVSDSTIYLGETALSVDGVGNLLVDGQPIADVGTAAWDNITGKPTIPTSFDRLVNGASEVVLDEIGFLTIPATVVLPEGVITYMGETDPGIVLGSSINSVFVRTLNGIDQYQWKFGTDGNLHFPDSSFQGTAFVGDATRLYGNVDQDVDIIARPPSTVTATTTAGAGGPFTGQFEISEPFAILAVQAGWEMNTGTEQSPIWTTVTNANLEPGEYWIYLDSGFEFEFAPSTAYTFRNPTPVLRTWTFGTDGDLTLPAGGDILDSNGTSVLGGGGAGPTQPYLELTDTPFITQPVTLDTPVTAIADLRGQDALVEVVIGEGPVIESITVTTPGVLYVVGQRYRINYYQVGGNSDNGNIDFTVATVGAGGALLTIANAAFAGPAQVNTGTYSDVSIEYRPTEFDEVDTGLTLTRGQYGGLFNAEEEYSYSSSVSPAGTLWNADGWGTLVGFNTRTYERFDLILTGPDNTPPGELIMWDTINDKYYKFAINIWGIDNNEFSYTRTLITDPNYFKKANYATANDVDVIEDDSTLQIGITRGLNGGIYNPFTEEDWNQNVSPDGTLWNVDGWNDLTDVETRTYTNFYAAYDQQLGNLVPGSQAVMYVSSIDKYYAIEWISWTQGINGNTQGGGFSYTRREIDLTKLTQGITFADGTVQTTAYTATNVVSTAVGDRRIETASGYKEVSVTQRVTNNYTGSTSQTTNGYELRIARTPELDAVIIPLDDGGLDATYTLSFDGETYREVWLSSVQSTEYWFYYQVDNNQTTPQTEGDVVYLRIVTGADSQIWWNKTDLPGGAGDFRGAVIDYHAYTEDATIIGTIHIVDDDGEEYITHTEVSSGSNNSMNDNLWIVTNEGSIRYARFDGEAKTLKIQWTAKVFYGSETND